MARRPLVYLEARSAGVFQIWQWREHKMEVMRIQAEIHDQQRKILKEKYEEEREKEKQKREEERRKVNNMNITGNKIKHKIIK